MKKVLAKLKVGSVVDYGNNNHEVNMTPVTSDSPENKTFSQYTPSGSVKLLINNPDTIGFFKAGEEYYAEFIPYVDVVPEDQQWKINKVHNNAIAFHEWLSENNISYTREGHVTHILGEVDMFELGISWGIYKINNAPRH